MLERLIHEPLAREIGQPLLTLSSLNKIDWKIDGWLFDLLIDRLTTVELLEIIKCSEFTDWLIDLQSNWRA